MAAADLPDSWAAGVADDFVFCGIYFSGGGGAGDCGETARSGAAATVVASRTPFGVDYGAGRGGACGFGGVASVCPVALSWEARGERAGRGTGGFDFRGVPGWTDDVGGWRRAGGSRGGGRFPVGAGCGGRSCVAVFVVAGNQAARRGGFVARASRSSGWFARSDYEFQGGRIVDWER